MVLFLLPWSRHQSRMDLVKEDLFDLWSRGEGNKFDMLNPLRKGILEELKVRTSPLAPVWRRYRGRFWEELSFWALPSRVQNEIISKAVVPSPVFGLLGAGDLIPEYRADWKTSYKGKSLREFWKEKLEALMGKLLSGAVLIDLLSYEDRKVFSFPESSRRIVFEYFRKDKRVINTLPHRAYTLRYIVEKGVGPEDLERINFLDYKVKEVIRSDSVIKVVLRSEGRYV